YMNTLTGLQLGGERSIPATPQCGIRGGLDVFYLFASTSLTDIGCSRRGAGFRFKGEIFYNFKLFGAPAAWGGSYTLDVFYNRLLNQQDQNKTSLVQSYRALATILSLVY